MDVVGDERTSPPQRTRLSTYSDSVGHRSLHPLHLGQPSRRAFAVANSSEGRAPEACSPAKRSSCSETSGAPVQTRIDLSGAARAVVCCGQSSRGSPAEGHRPTELAVEHRLRVGLELACSQGWYWASSVMERPAPKSTVSGRSRGGRASPPGLQDSSLRPHRMAWWTPWPCAPCEATSSSRARPGVASSEALTTAGLPSRPP